MGNEEHVERLKQGVVQWNQWREQHRKIRPNLSNATLIGANLRSADLSNADLGYANLSRTSLIYANLMSADLRDADLCDSNLMNADLRDADLGYADLRDADLRDSNLMNADLRDADLRGAYLSGAKTGNTVFARLDLRTVKGLAEINHRGSSVVQLHTVQFPLDGSALHFLRGAGVPDEWVDVWQSALTHPIQYHSLFISYSSQDETLARRLHADLQVQGVRCWFAPEDMKIGDRFHTRINEAIHMQDKLLLLLSEDALASSWVEIEVRAAMEKEHRQHRDVLFPVRLDNSMIETTQAWAAMLRQSRHIGDFTNWRDPETYQIAFDRLLRDLKKDIK